MPDVHQQVGDGQRRCERCGSTMPTRTHRKRAPDGLLSCPHCEGVTMPSWSTVTTAKGKADYEAETERIRERRGTAEARAPHDFQAAEWTHRNGHPRCRLCGDEERTGGRCAGADHDGLSTSAPGSKAVTTAALMEEAAVLDARDELARRHMVDAHGWRPESVADLGHRELRSMHRGLADAARSGDLAGPPIDHDEFGRPVHALRSVAHESPDDTVATHCPFDGSGQLIGLSDGSIECGYCQRVFTVRIQPNFATMPQTVTGLPPDPGMMAPPGAGMPGPGAPMTPPAGQALAPAPPGAPAGPGAPQGDPGVLVGPDGRPLPRQAYLSALAARHGLVPATEILDSGEHGSQHVGMDSATDKPMSKKQFEEHCNKNAQASGNEGWGNGSGPRSRPWGTWVRNADRDYFNEMYREYVEKGKLPTF